MLLKLESTNPLKLDLFKGGDFMLYIIVRHKNDTQRWHNSWKDENILEAITTTKELVKLCEQEKIQGNNIAIHRCGYKDSSSLICGYAEVDKVDISTGYVSFKNFETSKDIPPQKIQQGLIYYVDKR